MGLLELERRACRLAQSSRGSRFGASPLDEPPPSVESIRYRSHVVLVNASRGAPPRGLTSRSTRATNPKVVRGLLHASTPRVQPAAASLGQDFRRSRDRPGAPASHLRKWLLVLGALASVTSAQPASGAESEGAATEREGQFLAGIGHGWGRSDDLQRDGDRRARLPFLA